MSFIAIVLLILIIIFFIKFGKTSRKVTHWILSIYMAVLVVATVLVPLMTDNTINQKKVDQLEIDRLWNEVDKKLSQGQIDQVDAEYVLVETNFDVGHLKTLKLQSNKVNSTRVLIERKPSNDEKVDAFIFRKGLIINDYDFSDQLKPYHLELVDQTLRITSSQQEINLAISSNPFPIRQFTGESIMRGHSSAHGDQVIYLRIPHDLEVVANEQIDLLSVGG
ncbi:hypothetical protein [Ammoniphilus resinae]|uniref:Uncharacterized protein n=1 Tax=Ammoniphilus resinae TaxID=861532 RepID=A0ABS4GWC0_9BACL|nr:hypothetical protein [Ammoniphilus resinae]MBP1934541.1 hypothetical protein [Ammoniphilus resinae]